MKQYLWWLVAFVIVSLLILAGVEQSREFLVAFILRLLFFAKKYLIALLTSFFLVKGKFILTLFLKKIALLSATGLSKRYLIEKVINHNLKIHFLDYISDDVKRLVLYIRQNFKRFPIVKQAIATALFIGSLGFVGKFMGWMLAMKVFVAKFWSFILAIVLKVTTALVFFFTDYLWGSWIAPLIEVLLFSWLFEWLEKVPFLTKYIRAFYAYFIGFFLWIEGYLEKIFHIPAKQFFRFLARRIQKKIYRFIEYKRVSPWHKLQEKRTLYPSKYQQLEQQRKEYAKKKKKARSLNAHEALKQKRQARKRG
jgi:hypothetical protein